MKIFECTDAHGQTVTVHDRNGGGDSLKFEILQPDSSFGGGFILNAEDANDLIHAIYGTQGPEDGD